jgi:hypothetical protein
MSSSHNQRAAIAAYRAQFPDASYTRALNAVRDGWRPAPLPPRAYRGELGEATPPADWTEHASRCSAVAALWRDRDGDGRVDELVVFDVTTGARISSLVVPHALGPDADVVERAVRGAGATLSSPAGIGMAQQLELGQPNRLLHRLNHERFILSDEWQRWSDGSWRTPAVATDYTHSVTITTVDAATSRARLVVTEHPDMVVLDEVVQVRFDSRDSGPYFVAMNKVLDRFGYVVDFGAFENIASDVLYRRARVGHLAQRHWHIRAELRLLRDVTSRRPEGRPVTFRAGETVVMQRHGSAGKEVRFYPWASNSDVDASLSLRPEDVEVVRILEDLPPMHSDAAVDPAVLIELLAPYHPGAAEAVTAWAAAGLHLSLGTRGVEIRTPGPRYRLIGRVDRDYWNKNRLSKPYLALLHGERSRPYHGTELKQETLPLDPVTLVVDGQHVDDRYWTLPTDAPIAQVNATVEALLRRDFPEELADEIVDDDSSMPSGFETLVAAVREVAKEGPTAVSEAFAAVAADHADRVRLDELLYARHGAGRALAEQLEERHQALAAPR